MRRSGSIQKNIGTASSTGRRLIQSSELHHEARAVIESGMEGANAAAVIAQEGGVEIALRLAGVEVDLQGRG